MHVFMTVQLCVWELPMRAMTHMTQMVFPECCFQEKRETPATTAAVPGRANTTL